MLGSSRAIDTKHIESIQEIFFGIEGHHFPRLMELGTCTTSFGNRINTW